MGNNKISLDCEEFDAPVQVTWLCPYEKVDRTFNRKLKKTYLMGYTCSNCYYVLHPLTLVLAGLILEYKWNYNDQIWPNRKKEVI